MRVAIIGSRDYADLEAVRAYVRDELQADDVLISGGARGVDATAEEAARERGLRVYSLRPGYALLGRAAPFVRNAEIVAGCDRLVAFWDGVSGGTRNTVKLARRRGLPVELRVAVVEGLWCQPSSPSPSHST